MSTKRKHRLPQNPPAEESQKRLVVVEQPLVPLPSPEETLTLIDRLQQLRNCHVITLIAAPDVVFRGDITERVYEQLRNIGKVPQIDLFLHSSGGQTEIPWRLIALIRNFCDR